MIKLPFWNKVHPIIVRYKQWIMNLFMASYIFGFLLILLGFYSFKALPDIYVAIFELSHSLGTIALALFLTTLLPGIMQRFNIFPLFSASIVLFRRQAGILMFIVALVHSFYISTIPAIMTSSVGLEFMSKTEILGSVSLMILFPVWLTSNGLSQNKLGKFWKIIQRLTYFALIAIFLHVAQTSVKLSIVTFTVLLLELVSWLKVWIFDKRQVLPIEEKTLR